MQGKPHHHFCRWLLQADHSPAEALASAFPGASQAEAAHQIDTMSPRGLRDVFATIFGSPTTSNNTTWIRTKLKSALGLDSKRYRSGGTTGGKRKRRQGASDSGGGHSPKFVPRDTTPEPSHHLPLFLVSPGGGGAGGRMGRSPSSDWDSSGYFGLPYDDSAAVEGAVTLLAAAAEVEEQAAAAAAAAAAGASAGEGVSLGGPGSANGCGAESASAASGGTSAPAAAVTAPAPTAQLVLPAMAAATAPTTPAAKADGAVLAPAPVLLPAGLVALAQGESAGVPPAQFEAVWGRLQAEAQHKVVVLRLLAALAAASTGHAA